MSTRYPLFDVFRLVLALDVVRRHLFWNEPLGMKLIPSVPLFLAISGFLVLESYQRSSSWKDFARRRALRVLPAFLASLLLVFLLFGADQIAPILINWITGGFSSDSNRNGAVWSLGWEEVHYTLLGVLFALGAYRNTRVAWIGLAASSLFMIVVHPIAAYRIGRPLALPVAFFVGNLWCIGREHLKKLGPPMLGAFLAILAIRLAFPLTITNLNFWTGVNLLIATAAGSFAMLWAATTFRPNLPRFPDLSYGCYLYHVPLIGWLRMEKLSLWWLALALPVTCLVSWYLIEAPALRLKDRGRRPNATRQPELAKAETLQ